MGMAWMTALVEWSRRWGSLALLALLVTLAGGVPIGALAAARRANAAAAIAVTRSGPATAPTTMSSMRTSPTRQPVGTIKLKVTSTIIVNAACAAVKDATSGT